MSPLIGEDVIAQPGQGLDTDELTHLHQLADGRTPSEITRATGADRLRQQQLESSIRAKLGAKSKPHMIARGFVLGVLCPRSLTQAMCIVLAALSINFGSDIPANRTPRRSRTPATQLRAGRASKSDTSGGTDYPTQIVIESRATC